MPLIKRTAETATLAAPAVQADADSGVMQAATAPTETKPVYTGRKATSDTMSKEDWANKDRRISLQGLVQALLGSVNFGQYCPGTTAEEYLSAVEKASLRLAKFIVENGK